MSRFALSIFALLIGATAVQAHTGIGNSSGFSHGFSHPIGGIDHVLAMLAVGLFAARLGGRALWLVPLAFVTMMAVGAGAGVSGVNLPVAELGIGLSVVTLGIAIAAGVRPPTAAAMALVGCFAIFHGHAHAAEMPATASALHYGLGFILATAALHSAGIGLGLFGSRGSHAFGGRALQVTGSALALAGVVILAGYL